MTYYLHTMQGTYGGGFPWSVHAVSNSSDSESTAEGVWHTGWANFWSSAALIAIYPTTTTWTGTSTSTADTAFRQTTKTSTTASVSGTGSAAALPYQTAVIATLRSIVSTKWGRGRWYLPSPDVTALAATGYVWSATFMTDLQTALNAAWVSWASALQLQILHRKAALSGPTAGSLTPVTGMDISNKPAVQRRRGDKFVPVRTSITL